jgi:hypothetical protein
VFDDQTPYGLRGGTARFPLRVPVDARLLGGAFRAQVAEVGTRLYTSNAIDCTIARVVPTLGMAMVRANLDGGMVPTRGSVATARGPVIRFSF